MSSNADDLNNRKMCVYDQCVEEIHILEFIFKYAGTKNSAW